MRFPKLALKEDLIIQYPSIETHRTDPKGGALFRSPKKIYLSVTKSQVILPLSMLSSWQLFLLACRPIKRGVVSFQKKLSTTKLSLPHFQVHIDLSLSLTC